MTSLGRRFWAALRTSECLRFYTVAWSTTANAAALLPFKAAVTTDFLASRTVS